MATTLPTRAAITSATTTNAEQKINLGDLRDFIADMHAPSIQVFTATGTYTKPTGVRKIRVRVVGGGGAGGISGAANQASGGGEGGGYSEKWIDASAITTVAVTIGNGGNTTGPTAAGTTSFGAYMSAPGGSAGSVGSATAGASNGGFGAAVPTGGDINTPGDPGDPNYNSLHGGNGGAAGGGLGSGGRHANNGGAGIAGRGYGGGGSGSGDNSVTQAGGAGAPGVCIVEEFY